MGRLRKGYVRALENGRFAAEIAGEYLGTYATEEHAWRMVRASLDDNNGVASDEFAVFASDWMDKRELAARKRRRGRAFDKERSRWRAHVETAGFWHMGIKHIAKNPIVIQQWIGEMVEKEATQIIKYRDRVERRPTGRPLGKRVIEDSLSLVKLCLDDAKVAGKYKTDNPARIVKLPRFEDAEVALEGDLIKQLWPQEMEALFKLPMRGKERSIFAVAIFAGLRPEELWGLQWGDVLLDGPKPCIQVRRTWSGLLKTKFARRDVPLLPPAREALRVWKTAQTVTPIGGALVWPNPDGKCHKESYSANWRSKDDAGRHIAGWAERAGVRPEIDFKDLRHTCGCNLLQGTWTARPLSMQEIKRWLGHSSIAVTERHYAALRSDDLHDALTKPQIKRFGGLSADDD